MGEREKTLIAEVIDRGFPNDGPKTAEFERRVAELCGAPHAVAVTSGTTAMFLSLAAFGIGPGDEVIVPDITFIATANAVSLTGAKPVFVDVVRETFCIDVAAAERAITPRTKAVIPVHVTGRSADMKALLALARSRRLRVIEDAAEALGSKTAQGCLGAIGDAGCFSFTANKLVTTGQGGIILVRDAAVYQRLRELKDQGRPVRGTGGPDDHVSLGYNFKFTDLQAAFGLAQLETFAERCEHQRKLLRLYRKALDRCPRVRLAPFDLEGGELPLWIDADVEGCDDLCRHLEERGIQPRKFWKPVHRHPPYRQEDRAFPVSTLLASRAMWFPSGLDLNEDDVLRVCDAVRSWAKQPSHGVPVS